MDLFRERSRSPYRGGWRQKEALAATEQSGAAVSSGSGARLGSIPGILAISRAWC